MGNWTFLTNHAHVLLCIAKDPHVRLREIAQCVGITERAAHRIVCELETAGYIKRHRVGARNAYDLHTDLPLRHELVEDVPVGEILKPLLKKRAARTAKAA